MNNKGVIQIAIVPIIAGLLMVGFINHKHAQWKNHPDRLLKIEPEDKLYRSEIAE